MVNEEDKHDKTNADIKDYNPFEHRQVEKPNSDIRSLANLIKSSLGSGILAMPLAFANAGWGVGIVATIIIAIICAHCVQIFVETSRGCCRLERKPQMGYAETCRATFANGPKAFRPFANIALQLTYMVTMYASLIHDRFLLLIFSVFAEFAMLFTYLGVCCIFTVLISDSIKQLLDRYYPVTILPVEYYCLILMVPLCAMVQIRHLKWLAPSSLMANVLLIATFIICLYYIFGDAISFSDKKVVGTLDRFPAFLSTVIFAMEGIGVVMPVENTMKKPEHFLGCPSILACAMSLITVLYTVLGLFGYFRYGDVLKGSITLNLPMDHWPAICAKCFIALSIFLTYPLHYFVVIDIFTRYTQKRINNKYQNITQIVTRCIIVIFCGGIGMALPYLEQIINIVGALFYSTLGLIIPGIVETVFRWEDFGRFNYVMWKNCLIVVFGFCCLISGCHVTIMDIIANMQKKTE